VGFKQKRITEAPQFG